MKFLKNLTMASQVTLKKKLTVEYEKNDDDVRFKHF
jgi:hypothetical protein